MMSSEISIIKKFLTIGYIEDTFTIVIKDCNLTFYCDSLLIQNFNSSSNVYISYGEYDALFIGNEYISTIENVDEFINSDDISLVLKYGRKITNEYILNLLKEDSDIPLDITMDDFKEYFELRITGDSK